MTSVPICDEGATRMSHSAATCLYPLFFWRCPLDNHRTIGFYPCVGKKASGEGRPTSVVIRSADGSYAIHEFGEQDLLDFFTCGAPIGWRPATVADLGVVRPPHHGRWEESDKEAYDAATDDERAKLFVVVRAKRTDEIRGYSRLHVPTGIVILEPATDTVGVANGGLGYHVMDVLLGRYPQMDVRVVGSGTLKENRATLDGLLPKKLQKSVAKVRAAAEKDAVPDPLDAEAANDEEDDGPELSKAAAKDANAKFDAHRIAFALADDAASKLFHRCTLRDRDWAAATLAYGQLADARKARVAAEQQFRQIHRAALRHLVKDQRIGFVTLGGDGEDQKIDTLLASYADALKALGYDEKAIGRKMDVLRTARDRIEGASAVEEGAEKDLEIALRALPEYVEFLSLAKSAMDGDTKLPLGKYIGERIFGRWIAGFGSPMSSRLGQPPRASDIQRISACRESLSTAIASFIHREGLPDQPAPGGGKTREWLLACERLATTDAQKVEIAACRDAYRALVNAKKCASNRPLNRVIAFMGLHVRRGGKYEGTAKDREFPRRRKGGRANWNEELLRQGAYQWVTLIIKGGDSYWKANVYQPYKDKLVAGGMPKGHAHKRAFWRTATVAVRWLVTEWFEWERKRSAAPEADRAAA